MTINHDITRNVDLLEARSGGLKPRVGIILGSGLGPLAEDVADPTAVPYGDLHGFPMPGVGGHAGRLLLGNIAGTPVAMLHGRSHYYEAGRADAMKVPVRTLAALGCEALILTNAAGSLRAEVGPGSVMAINDHISLTGVSPLFGEPGDGKFVNMVDAYDPALRARLQETAKANGLTLHDGVYAWFCGPHFETPAEIRAARVLGADAVGMSTVPECILARHAGMKVAALSIVTNLAAGMDDIGLSHDQTLSVAARAAGDVRNLLLAFLKDWPA
ncbi:MAG: purine-nucleoside phosphorylase [Alphaproteobacteria bacterium]|nr:purine-nucleoside phosphorylase [Alphaproteobacteria bacterium]